MSIDMGKREPMVAMPDRIRGNRKPMSEIGRIEIDVAVVGSCASGRLSDIRDVAEVLNGRKISDRTVV